MFDFNVVVFGYILPIVLTLGLLIFWRKCTTWNKESIFNDDNMTFPSRFHVLFLFVLSLIPGVGLFEIVVLASIYAVNRATGSIKIKPGKHTKFWFDVDNDE